MRIHHHIWIKPYQGVQFREKGKKNCQSAHFHFVSFPTTNLEGLPAGRIHPVGEDGGAAAHVRDEVPVLGHRLELELGAILHKGGL